MDPTRAFLPMERKSDRTLLHEVIETEIIATLRTIRRETARQLHLDLEHLFLPVM
jgi:hypothetical protein